MTLRQLPSWGSEYGGAHYVTLRRLSLLIALVALFYLGTIQLGPVGWYLHDVMTPPVANDGYSGYTMYERCHIDSQGVMHPYYTGRRDC